MVYLDPGLVGVPWSWVSWCTLIPGVSLRCTLIPRVSSRCTLSWVSWCTLIWV
ncbi:hypothetical protein HYD88_03985 [Mycoplasmopsis bovis]|nr:hypothetical protein [Mycoplasmopsis bovis]QQH36509.1 hypothetical protein HYD88_03985 [Mycoplasmopsis bovis]